MTQTLIQQYVTLLLRVGDPNDPLVLAFVQRAARVPGFLEQVKRMNASFANQQKGQRQKLSFRQALEENIAFHWISYAGFPSGMGPPQTPGGAPPSGLAGSLGGSLPSGIGGLPSGIGGGLPPTPRGGGGRILGD